MKVPGTALSPAFAALPQRPGVGWRPASTQRGGGGGGTSNHKLQLWEELCIQSTAEQISGQMKPPAFGEVSPPSLPWADSDTSIPPPADSAPSSSLKTQIPPCCKDPRRHQLRGARGAPSRGTASRDASSRRTESAPSKPQPRDVFGSGGSQARRRRWAGRKV